MKRGAQDLVKLVDLNAALGQSGATAPREVAVTCRREEEHDVVQQRTNAWRVATARPWRTQISLSPWSVRQEPRPSAGEATTPCAGRRGRAASATQPAGRSAGPRARPAAARSRDNSLAPTGETAPPEDARSWCWVPPATGSSAPSFSPRGSARPHDTRRKVAGSGHRGLGQIGCGGVCWTQEDKTDKVKSVTNR